MIATKMTMNTTPPTTPPTTGARGNLPPPPFELFSIRFVEEDGPLDKVEEVGSAVVEEVSNWVEDWGAKGQNGQHGRRGLSIH